MLSVMVTTNVTPSLKTARCVVDNNSLHLMLLLLLLVVINGMSCR
jgi:hypothetical protein